MFIKKSIGVILLLAFCFTFAFGLIVIADKTDEPKCKRFSEELEDLVKEGVITNEELVKVKDYFKIEREERKKLFEKMKSMDEAQRKEYMEDYRKNKVNVVDKMVEDKVINEEQGERIKEIMPKHKHNHNHKHKNKTD